MKALWVLDRDTLSSWDFSFKALVILLSIITYLLSFWEFLSWKTLLGWGFVWHLLTLTSGFIMYLSLVFNGLLLGGLASLGHGYTITCNGSIAHDFSI